MLSKNSTLIMVAVLLFSNAALVFANENSNEVDVMKEIIRIAAVEAVVNAQGEEDQSAEVKGIIEKEVEANELSE